MTVICPTCNKTFANRHSLYTHHHKFHNQEGGKGVQIINWRKDQERDNETKLSTVSEDSNDYSIAPTENSQDSNDSIKEWKQQQIKEGKYKKMIRSMNEKVKLYEKTMKSLQNKNVRDLYPLEDIIFNESMMAKIAKVEKLIGNYKFDELEGDNLEVLQIIFSALICKVIPITRPQLEHLTEEQKKLPELIALSEPDVAIQIVAENMQELVNLFSTIKDSLKLVRKSFHKFPYNPDKYEREGDDESEGKGDDESDYSMED